MLSGADCLGIFSRDGMCIVCEISPRANDSCRVGDRSTKASDGEAKEGLVTAARGAKIEN